MMAIDRLDWSQEIISAMGLSADKFPRMATPAHQEGVISNDAALATGFAPGTPICRGGGDQQCAAIGAGVIREGMAEITVGTAAMMVAHIDERRQKPDQVAYIGGHAFPHKWDLEGGAFATGACFRWWRDVFGQLEKQTSEKLNLDVFDLLTMEASKAPVGSKGHIFFPFMNGQATPTYDNTARGGSLGLTLAHDRPAMIRSVLEGTGYELRMVVEALEKALGNPFDILRLTGGGAKSTLWVQIQADIYGRLVETLQNPECTTFGAAILGGVGTGVFNSIEEAVQSLVKKNLIIEPNIRRHKLYSELFCIFQDTFQALREKKVYDRLSEIQDRI
jgi:xylulokinase